MLSERSVLVQIHMPRSAGTSVSEWLRSASVVGLTSGHAAVYPEFNLRLEADLDAPALSDPRISTVSSHNIRSFPKTWSGRPVYYFTILRDPIEQFASYVRYMIEHREAFHLPRRLVRLEEIAEWCLDSRFGEVGLENPQTNHLALYPWCQLIGGRCDPTEYARWSADEHHGYWNARLSIAQTQLQSFLCVGVFDRLYDSLRVLHARSEALGIHLLAPEGVPNINGTRRSPGDLAWLAPGTPLGNAVATSLETDRELYRFAGTLLDRSLASLGSTRRASAS